MTPLDTKEITSRSRKHVFFAFSAFLFYVLGLVLYYNYTSWSPPPLPASTSSSIDSEAKEEKQAELLSSIEASMLGVNYEEGTLIITEIRRQGDDNDTEMIKSYGGNRLRQKEFAGKVYWTVENGTTTCETDMLKLTADIRNPENWVCGNIKVGGDPRLTDTQGMLLANMYPLSLNREWLSNVPSRVLKNHGGDGRYPMQATEYANGIVDVSFSDYNYETITMRYDVSSYPRYVITWANKGKPGTGGRVEWRRENIGDWITVEEVQALIAKRDAESA